MLHPAVTHPACELDRLRRVREARIRAAVRRRRRRGRPAEAPDGARELPVHLPRQGEDVWAALRT